MLENWKQRTKNSAFESILSTYVQLKETAVSMVSVTTPCGPGCVISEYQAIDAIIHTSSVGASVLSNFMCSHT